MVENLVIFPLLLSSSPSLTLSNARRACVSIFQLYSFYSFSLSLDYTSLPSTTPQAIRYRNKQLRLIMNCYDKSYVITLFSSFHESQSYYSNNLFFGAFHPFRTYSHSESVCIQYKLTLIHDRIYKGPCKYPLSVGINLYITSLTYIK